MIGNEAVVIKRQPENAGVNKWGQPIPAVPETTRVEGCLVQWGTVGETNTLDYRESTESAIVYMPINTFVKTTDVLTVRGKDYVVDGEPVRWEVPRGFSLKPKLIVQIKKESR